MDHKVSDLTLIHDEHRQHHRGFGRCFFVKVAMVLFGGFLLFLGACDRMNGTRGKETMAMTKIDSAPKLPIPPIDASAPAKTETATFALG